MRAQEATIKRLRQEVRVANRERIEYNDEKPRAPLSDLEWDRSLELRPGSTTRRLERLAGLATSARWRDDNRALMFRLPESLAADLLQSIRGNLVAVTAAARLSSATDGAAENNAAAARLSSATGEAAENNAAAAQLSSATDEAAENNAAAARLSSATGEAAECDAAANEAADVGSAEFVATTLPMSVKTATAFLDQGQEVPAWVGLMAMLEGYLSTWDRKELGRSRPQNSTHETYGYMCAAPMCSQRCNLDEHHVLFRSRGGGQQPDNRASLCRPHHQRGVHPGLQPGRHGDRGSETLVIYGTKRLERLWRVGRPDVAEWYRNERRVPPPTEDELMRLSTEALW